MDYEKLSELLFPHVKHTHDYFEKKYPKRNLKKGQEVTRFAPSPTGFLHFGSFFSAFLNKQIAKSSEGAFFVRLEDTDKKREIEGSGLIAFKTLEEFGLNFDEGIKSDGTQFGNYAPYIQSERLEIYQAYAKKLVKKGRAFPCFCKKAENLEEIEKNREDCLAQSGNLEEKDPCRNLLIEDIEKEIKSGKPFALRLKSNGNKDEKILAKDLIRGEKELSANCKDIILIKSDGYPPYAFAHVVDDFLMGTTIVLRGEEWFPSYPAHLEIFNAFGFKPISYIHTPTICKIDQMSKNKRKLSKRKDKEADMRFFLEEGYPKDAVLEYLMTLANSNFEIWRIENPNAPLSNFKFSIEKINVSNPMFDLNKLIDISKNIIGKMSGEEVYERILKWSEIYDYEFNVILKEEPQYAIEVFSIDRNKENPRKDFAKWSDFKSYFSYMFGLFNPSTLENYELDKTKTKEISTVLKTFLNIFNENDDKDVWFSKIKEMSNSLGYAINQKSFKENPKSFKGTVADVCTFIRLALTGRVNSPDLFTIIKILGKEKVKIKIEKMIELLY